MTHRQFPSADDVWILSKSLNFEEVFVVKVTSSHASATNELQLQPLNNPVSQDWEEQSEFWCRRFAVLLLGSETLKMFWSLKVEHWNQRLFSEAFVMDSKQALAITPWCTNWMLVWCSPAWLPHECDFLPLWVIFFSPQAIPVVAVLFQTMFVREMIQRARLKTDTCCSVLRKVV